MLELGFALVWYVSVLAGALTLVALAIGLAGRWSFARRIAKASTLAALLLVPLLVAVSVIGFGMISESDASLKAKMMAMTVSSVLNCSVPLVSSLFVAAMVWWVSSRRLRTLTAAAQEE